MTANGPLWLTEADVASLMTINDTIEALRETLAAQAQGQARNVRKALVTWGGGRSSGHSLGSIHEAAGLIGFKTWVNTPDGAATAYALFGAADGRLIALMQAASLGSLRTSAISGLATSLLAPSDADEMAVVGTGRQALYQVAAVAAVRPIRRLRVFSPTAERRAAFVERARAAFGIDVLEAASVADGVRDAPIVTLVTRAAEPFLTGAMLARGALLNAVGALLPQRAEFTQDVFNRAGLVVVDDVENVRQASREFIERYGADEESWDRLLTLGQLLSAGTRPPAPDVTVFKAVGMGLSDLAVARVVARRAAEAGVGHALPSAARTPLRWQAAPLAVPAQ